MGKQRQLVVAPGVHLGNGGRNEMGRRDKRPWAERVQPRPPIDGQERVIRGRLDLTTRRQHHTEDRLAPGRKRPQKAPGNEALVLVERPDKWLLLAEHEFTDRDFLAVVCPKNPR